MKKNVIGMVIIMSIVSFLFGGCSWGNVRFSNIEEGEIFSRSRDGHYKKLPYNYCLDIEFVLNTRLFKVADEHLDTLWDSSVQHEEFILKGHYIKGFYNDNYLVLCEEQHSNSYVYWSFDFSSQKVESYLYENDVYELYNFNSNQWFSLCNTYAEIIK